MSSASAHGYGAPGLNNAQIDLSNDGYAPNHLSIWNVIDVSGRSFKPLSVAQIFECPDTAVNLHTDCLPVGEAPTDAEGNFHATGVPIVSGYSTVSAPANPNTGTGVACRGRVIFSQCEIVAATYDAVTQQPNAKASHYICWDTDGRTCKPLPADTDPTTTTTTTSTTTTTVTPPTTDPGGLDKTVDGVVDPPLPTTTTVPLRQADPCTLREDTARTAGDYHSDPTVDRASNSTPDMLWQQQRLLPASPPARQGHAMAYLPPAQGRAGQTVLFGGFRAGSSGCVLGDTWIWDGTTWRQALDPQGQPVPGPPARYGHAMAYDGKDLVVFGGYDGLRDLSDTWTWDGAAWTSRDTAETAPRARARTSMTHHAANPADVSDDGVVLFGGDYVADGQVKLLGDTWTWDPRTSRWTEHSPVNNPMPRSSAQMAYRPGSGAVLHGGRNGVGLNGTFVWTGTTWEQTNGGRGTIGQAAGTGINGISAPHGFGGALAHHPATGMIVFQNGIEYNTRIDGPSGAWDGTGWIPSPSASTYTRNNDLLPPNRLHAAMAEDARGQVVYFGGFGPAAVPTTRKMRARR